MAEAGERLKVLVVDDQEVNLLLLTAILQQQGHDVVRATNGREAVDVFERSQPDLVLMDVMMPVMDGYEAARIIRERAGDRFMPIIFVTALRDEASLIKALQAGGQDFITKPYSHAILKAKIDALLEQRRMYETMRLQRDELELHQQWIQHEHKVAESLFQKILHSSALTQPGVRYVLSPQAIFNGDLLIAAFRPSGQLNVLLGDFTGHGLSAAIGTIPVSDIFQGMTIKGFAIPEIASEINKKLQAVLPRGLFLAATLVEIDSAEGVMKVWNGGLPEAILYDAEAGRIRSRLQTRHFPLGLVGANQFDKHIDIYPIGEHDRLYLFTDGVTEAANAEGEMFGDGRLQAVFDGHVPVESLLDTLLEQVTSFRGQQLQTDDFTLAEFQVGCLERLPESSALPAVAVTAGLDAAGIPEWTLAFEMQPPMLRSLDPLPVLMQVLMEVQHLYQHKEQIYIILAELYSNALEHGVLGLRSQIKNEPEGFQRYYTAREDALNKLTSGYVRFAFQHFLSDGGGRIVIKVEDSGSGFDYANRLTVSAPGHQFHGRGLSLLNGLCESLEYRGRGNEVVAVYAWQHDGSGMA